MHITDLDLSSFVSSSFIGEFVTNLLSFVFHQLRVHILDLNQFSMNIFIGGEKKPSSPEFTKKLITFTFDSQLDVRLPEISFSVT